MSMKRTIVIKDSNESTFKQKLDSVLNDYTYRIFNINTGIIHDGYDSRDYIKVHYYAIVVVEG